ISMIHVVIDYLLIRNTHFYLNEVAYSNMCLMRKQQIYICFVFAIHTQCIPDHFLEFHNSMFEDSAPIHLHVETAAFNKFRRKSILTAASRVFHIKLLGIVSVSMQMR